MQACPQIPSESAVKARMVLSLARFVQWPAQGEGVEAGVLRVCVAARQGDAVAAFSGLHGQVVAGRTVHVQPVSGAVAGAEAAPCHVLYLHSSAERAAELLAQAGRSATLTVGDAEGFLNRGGMVELMLVNDAIRFDIHLKALRAAQLTLSSQVLRLARQVRE
jgi:YfiR/HmsC-like